MLEYKLEEFKKVALLAKARGGKYAKIGDRILAFIKNPKDYTFLKYCAENGKINLLTMCAQAGIDMSIKFEVKEDSNAKAEDSKSNSKSKHFISLVEIAKENGHDDCALQIDKLIKEQNQLSIKLFEAIKVGRVKTINTGKKVQLGVEDCINQGAVVDWKDKFGTTSLIFACQKGKTKMVKMLLQAGADVNAKDCMGATPLMWASYGNKVEILEILVKAGAKVNDKDKENGSTPLIWWATNSKDNVEGIEYLIKCGARTSTQIKPSKVAKRDSDDIKVVTDPVEWFKKKWDIEEKYFDSDRNALDYARSAGNGEIAKYLENYEKIKLSRITDL